MGVDPRTERATIKMLVEDTISTTTATAMNNEDTNFDMAKLISRNNKNQSKLQTECNGSDREETNCKLLEIHQIPSHLRFNKYIKTHYRPATNFVGCLKSL